MSVQVYAGGVLAYDDRLPAEKNYTLLSGLISESLNKGGTATIVMPPGHPACDAFPALVVPVEIYKNGRLRWRGRPLPNASDIYGRRTVTCEGELCFLNDVVSRPYAYSGDPAELFARVLEAYNAVAEPWKRFVVGTISVTGDAIDLSSTDPEKVLATVQKLIKAFGGYVLFDSAPNGSRRINWYSQLPYACNQRIRYGYNLTDYSSQSDLNGFATRIVPYGAEDENGKRIKININGKDYVENGDAIASRGVIEKPVIYDEISDPEELRIRAEQDVQASGVLPAIIKLSAVDMSRLDLRLDGFRMGQRVDAESNQHGMAGTYDLVALTEDIVNPTVGQATLTRDAVYIDLAGGTMTGAINKQLQTDKEEYRKSFSSFMGAVANMTATILGAKGGAVRLLDTDGDGMHDTLYISDNPDPEQAVKVWRFNYEGWGASQNGYNGPFKMGATLKDGFLADFITAGTLDAALITVKNLVADCIKSGILSSVDGDVEFDLDQGCLITRKAWGNGQLVFMYTNNGIDVSYAQGNSRSTIFNIGVQQDTSTGASNVSIVFDNGLSVGGLGNLRLTSNGDIRLKGDNVFVNPGKKALFTGSCAKDSSCTVPNTANYDLFAVYLGDGTTTEITPVLCYKNGNNIRGCGARAGTTTDYKELHFFEATISGNTWTVSDAGKHSVYMSGGMSDGTRLQLMKVVGVI